MGIVLLGIVIALVGFVLLLKPEIIWRRFQKEEGATLSGPTAAFLRLVGIAVLILSATVVQMVG